MVEPSPRRSPPGRGGKTPQVALAIRRGGICHSSNGCRPTAVGRFDRSGGAGHADTRSSG
jgi:hypothetical protein